MAVILIKDLLESQDLDRQAMGAIVGGARSGVRQTIRPRAMVDSTRIVNFPAGGATASQPALKPGARSKGCK
jgi:hypothetical protein